MIVNGDILEAAEPIIVQQVNCMGVMGAGLAKSIRWKYPQVYREYTQYCDVPNKKDLLGTVLPVNCGDKWVFNLFAQYGYGRQGCYTDYNALERCFKAVRFMADGKPIAVPYGIGCGFAGGNWDTVSYIIEKVFADYPITLYRKE